MAEYRGYIKWFLFLSSYAPLYPILAIKHFGVKFDMRLLSNTPIAMISRFDLPLLSIFWVSLMVISLLFLWLAWSVRMSKEPSFTDISDLNSRNDLVTNYILVYIFPFVVLDFSEPTNWIAFIIFFLVIGVIQVRANLLFVNPVLSLFKYDIYEAESDRGKIMLIAKGDLRSEISPGKKVRTVELSNRVHIIR